ncbi:hypothetical protein D3C78_1726410 [compost metagenome]
MQTPFRADCIPFVRDTHQGVQALSEQFVCQFRLFGASRLAMRQRPRQRVDARFTLLRQLGIQIAVRRQHAQGLGAKQDEPDQQGGT